ncbi:hypothetical protein C1X05_13600 [Laceyella sacchari]|uniref:Secreted protein n=1 Tax=Laceyella tengchongensis TaxID=574699 RepID=A0AA45WSD4_9BACL|nr:hypothetical protein [Laceyella tengchongensis]AUS09752.1 hypothetical protein C1X05_13600 [Laceyella sacchari]SMP36580.1 hypothetical protein SAMN06265361_1233 [Laceyella tengchongensis]
MFKKLLLSLGLLTLMLVSPLQGAVHAAGPSCYDSYPFKFDFAVQTKEKILRAICPGKLNISGEITAFSYEGQRSVIVKISVYDENDKLVDSFEVLAEHGKTVRFDKSLGKIKLGNYYIKLKKENDGTNWSFEGSGTISSE